MSEFTEIPNLLQISVKHATTRWSLAAQHRTDSELGKSSRVPVLILFEMFVDGEQIGLIEATAEEVGVPKTFDDALASEANDRFVLPDHVIAALRVAFAADVTIWVNLQSPVGFLPVVPWETLLLTFAQRRSVRLGPQTFSPVLGRGTIDTVLCFSCPLSEQKAQALVDLFFSMIPRTKRSVRVHIFANERIRKELLRSKARFGELLELHIYDPREISVTASIDTSQTSDSASAGIAPPDESPWITWMRAVLWQYSIEYMHFVCNGYLGNEFGAIRFAAPLSDDDTRWSRHVATRELNAFLEEIGTWSVSFSSPPENVSIAGLRYLAHELAQLRSGPIALHDMARDEGNDGLETGYKFFRRPASFEGSSAIVLYWNPLRPSRKRHQQESLQEYTIPSLLTSPYAGGALVRMQRSLETSLLRINSEPKNEVEATIQRGRENALRATSHLLTDVAAYSKIDEANR